MEKIEHHYKTNNSTKKFLTRTLLVGILGLSTVSCWETTQKDINEQRHKVELLSFNISHYIDARKKLVNEYNTILKYPRTEANQYEIDNHLSLLEEQIEEYDEKIKECVEDKLDAEAELNEKIEDRWIAWVHTSIDPNKRDYLLQIN